ncbi:polymer-forming cytoskeletal protein [Natronomonas gomsonensis]|uniref:polymer-forming cytoskeletal protein n=1 Tax=Natronomonas gomsonensis TaxID=1046043 RepID=UPI0015C18C0D|nr:polymer-forming cytoskeletal protein [Natronomonas gomsonensis]
MSLSGQDPDFWNDRRGISALIGAMFLFAFVVILISMNQAYVVPQENSKIEFQHFQDTQSELVSVRSSILQAGQADVSQYATVKLGTNYPTRIFAVNPPPPSGTIRTSEAYDIEISNSTDTVTISTRFIEYRPGYNELSVGSTWYENSILYLDETQQGGRIIYEDQQLVTNGDTLRITALQNEFDESGTGRVALELYPTETTTAGDIPTGDLDIRVPTRLTSDEYWEEAMQGQSFYDGVTEDDYETGVHALEFSIDTSQDSNDLQVNTVGIQSEPTEGPSKQNVGSGSGDGTDSGDDGNGGFPSCTEFLSGNSFDIGKDETCEGDVTLLNNGDIDIGENAEVIGTLRIMGNGNIDIKKSGRIDGDLIVDQNANGQIKNKAEVTGCVDVGTNNLNVNPNADIQYCNA